MDSHQITRTSCYTKQNEAPVTITIIKGGESECGIHLKKQRKCLLMAMFELDLQDIMKITYIASKDSTRYFSVYQNLGTPKERLTTYTLKEC